MADLRGRRDDDAEDTAQDALLAAWSKLDTFRGDCEFATWVHTIVTRLALNKATRRTKTLPFDDQPPIADRRPGPAQDAETSSTGAMIRAAVNDLPAAQARAITLHDLDGLSYADIARVTRTTVPAVRSHLFRGRRQLACVAGAWR